MHNFRPLAYLCALLALAATLSACQREAAQVGANAEARAEARAEADAQAEAVAQAQSAEFRARTLQMQTAAFTPVPDPLMTADERAASISLNLYEPLLTFPPQSRRLADLQPLLATAWKASSDGLSYRLNLREGVRFHTGREMECADAEYSLRRALVVNPDGGAADALAQALLGTSRNAARDEGVTWAQIAEAVQCVPSEESTGEGSTGEEGTGEELLLTLPTPNPDFLTLLTLPAAGVIDRQAAAEQGDWDGTEATWRDFINVSLEASPPVLETLGTGAYQRLSSDVGTLIFGVHEGYWGGRPYFERVVLTEVPLLETRAMSFAQGDADLIELEETAADINFALQGVEGFQVTYGAPLHQARVVGMRAEVTARDWLGTGNWEGGAGMPADLLGDADMRQCLALAFDYALYASAVLGDQGVARGAPIPEEFEAAPALPAPKQDLAAAEGHCRRAYGGQVWDKGFELRAAYNGEPNRLPLDILADEMGRMNPLFRISPAPTAYPEGAPLAVYGWRADVPTVPHFTGAFYRTGGLFAGWTGMADPELDALLDAAATEGDSKRRAQLYAEAAAWAQAEARYIVLPTPLAAQAATADITGLSAATLQPQTGVLWRELGRE